MTGPARPARRHPDPHDLLRTALDFARVGVPVFPVIPGGKRPLTRHGFQDASADSLQIRAWWRRWPTANLAVPTGRGSFDVLDIDVHGNRSGFPALNRLNREGLLNGWARQVATPSGGLHLWFPGTEQTNSSIPGECLDFRATGGYVLVPPSVVNGVQYELWHHLRTPGTPLDWSAVRGFLSPPLPSPDHATRHLTQDIAPLARWVTRLPEGQRNTGTFWAACRAVEAGHEDLTSLVDAAVAAGLPFHEAARTVTSAMRTVKATGAPLRDPPARQDRRTRSRG